MPLATASWLTMTIAIPTLLLLSVLPVWFGVRKHRMKQKLSFSSPEKAEAQTPQTDVLMTSVKKTDKSEARHKIHKIITLYLFAETNKPYAGYSLLQTLLSADLEFGTMNIFHHYLETPDNTNADVEPLYSLASVISPGTFDLNTMGEFSSPGLVLFMKLDKLSTHLRIGFNRLLNTAYALQDDLGGTLCDENHQQLTKDKVQQWLNTIETLETGQLTGDLFD